MTSAPKTKRKGFAAMTQERQREIASLGGKAAHAKGRAHVFTTEEARIAGRKGGIVSQHNAFLRGQGQTDDAIAEDEAATGDETECQDDA
jgi:general stress protein YciG